MKTSGHDYSQSLLIVEIKKAKIEDSWLIEKGVYRIGTTDGKKTATMSCPNCGVSASLSHHDIDEKGNVSPSVVCPNESCSFHEYVQLVDF